MLHVYGVVPAGTVLPEVTGVGSPGGRPYLVEEHDLAAVVSEIADPAELTDDDAVTHLDVLTAITATDTALPLRFGTAAPDADAVRAEVLAAAAPVWHERLAALDGLVELRVDFGFDEQDVLREVVSRQPQLRELGGDNVELSERVRAGEAVVQAVREWTRERGEELLGPLAGSARQVAALDGEEPTESRWALLVPRERVADVDREVQHIDTGEPAARVGYVGPLPAYDFPDETAAEATAGSRWGW